jgi:beta-glucosidase
LHAVAADLAGAAGLALTAGVDVELPSVHAYGDPLLQAVREGAVPEQLVDRALRRVLRQKCELGLLDAGWEPLPADLDQMALDDEQRQETALELARRAVVLVANPDAVLPLAPGRRLAVVGPLADDPMSMLGCYSFPAHVGVRHPEHGLGLEIPTVLAELRARYGDVTHVPGCSVTGEDRSGLAAAVQTARDADVCVVVVGDQAGLFGRGTSGEGCDATDLRLPGVQAELVRAVVETGTPVVLTLLTGRPYALGDLADDASAVVQAFFPGQLGGRAVAEVLTGETNPSGRLPVSIPREPAGQPGTYLAAPLGRRSGVSSVDPTPHFPFGHGLGYSSFAWDDARVLTPDGDPARWDVDGDVDVEVTVTNTGDRAGADIVQLYLHDVAAQVVQPVVRLVAYARVDLGAGEAARVRFTVPADVTSFTGLAGRRVVEPGDVELRLARSSAETHTVLPLRLVGEERAVGHDRRLATEVQVTPARSAVGGLEEVSA